MISALPVSGAWHPKTTDAHCDRPRISLSRASFSWPKPCPPNSGPRCVAHRPWRRTSAFTGSIASLRFPSSGTNCMCGNARSSGSISSRTNWSTQSSFSWYSGSVSKSHAMCNPPSVGFQNMILAIKNAIPTSPPADVAGRIVRRPLSKREDQYASEVRRLLDAALEVIRRCGTSSRPRVADIVAEAGLSNDAFYRHFRSKDALVTAVLQDGGERLQSYLAQQMAKESTPEGQVRRWVRGVLSQADKDIAATTLAVLWNASALGGGPAAGRHFASAPVSSLLRQPFTDLGSATPELDAALAAHATLGLLSDCLWRGAQAPRAGVEGGTAFFLGAVPVRSVSRRGL